MPAASSQKKDTILVVDDDPLILEIFQEIVGGLGATVLKAASLDEARKILRQNHEVSVLLCDQVLPDGHGLNYLKEIKSTHPSILRLLITGHPETRTALDAINEGEIFRFITKPSGVEEITFAVREALDRCHLLRENQRLQAALVSGNEELQRANQSLEQALSNSVKLCLDILDRFDHILAGHSTRVARWAGELGKVFGLSGRDLETLEFASQMHDIGLISVSRSFHRQQQIGWEDLPPLQQTALQCHPKTSAELVQFLHQKGVPEIVANHHEWFNGKGYPNRLTNEQIPFMSAIIAVPDAYDEFPASRTDAAKFVEENLAIRFHPEVGRAFLRLLQERPELVKGEREVLISELTPNMQLTCNIFSASGVMLAPKGQLLTPKIIQYVKQHDQSDPLTQRIFVVSP
jgi:response regulator RpfG family c-di-GMP phosphodiesterase